MVKPFHNGSNIKESNTNQANYMKAEDEKNKKFEIDGELFPVFEKPKLERDEKSKEEANIKTLKEKLNKKEKGKQGKNDKNKKIKKTNDFYARNAAQANKAKRKSYSLEKEKQELEAEECTFKPKLTKYRPETFKNKRINPENYYTKQLNDTGNKFYDRNVNWLKEINERSARKNKEKKDFNLDDCCFFPKTNKINKEKVFNNTNNIAYWLKTNKDYLARKKIFLDEIEREKQETNKKKRPRSVEKNYYTNPSKISNEVVFKTIDYLHNELHTINDTNEEDKSENE